MYRICTGDATQHVSNFGRLLKIRLLVDGLAMRHALTLTLDLNNHQKFLGNSSIQVRYALLHVACCINAIEAHNNRMTTIILVWQDLAAHISNI